MAKKEQCLGCRSYVGGVCKVYGTYPQYDNSGCSDYASVETEKEETQVMPDTPLEENTQIAQTEKPQPQTEIEEEVYEEPEHMFSHPFSFSGRIRRMEFGLSLIIYLVCYYLVFIIAGVSENPAALLLIIPVLWFYLAQNVKRFHDRNMSGWSFLFYFIPLYNLYVIACQIFADGDDYENDYGPDPKGRRNA